jgi:hypothetical protein
LIEFSKGSSNPSRGFSKSGQRSFEGLSKAAYIASGLRLRKPIATFWSIVFWIALLPSPDPIAHDECSLRLDTPLTVPNLAATFISQILIGQTFS